MCKNFLIVCVLLFGIIAAKAQGVNAQTEKLRVAVFDPTSSSSSIDEGTRDAVRELISSVFFNTGKYVVVGRSSLQQAIKIQRLSNTIAFDENQASELGRAAGADKAVLSVISLVNGRNMLSIKLIDINTATIEQQRAKVVDANDLLDAVEPLTLSMLGERGSVSDGRNNATTQNQRTSNRVSPVNSNDKLTQNDDSNTVFACGIEIQANDLYKEKVRAKDIVCPDGWRLPTREELKNMCAEQKKIGNFKSNPFSYYFTGEVDKRGKVYTRSFDDCKEDSGTDEAWVRCVRDK